MMEASELTGLVAMDDIPVELTIRLGRAVMSVKTLAALAPDDIVPLDHEISDGVDICIGEKVIARGELTATEGDRIAVRILGGTEAP